MKKSVNRYVGRRLRNGGELSVRPGRRDHLSAERDGRFSKRSPAACKGCENPHREEICIPVRCRKIFKVCKRLSYDWNICRNLTLLLRCVDESHAPGRLLIPLLAIIGPLRTGAIAAHRCQRA